MPVVGQISVGDGATFTPSVSNSGVISWSNDKNLPNPASVDIAGVVQTAISGVYLPTAGGTVTGNLTVNGTITGNLSGNATTATTAITATNATTAASATNDGNGNEITATYLPLAGGTLTGNLTENSDLIVNGNAALNTISATGNATVGGALGVTGATTLASVSVTGSTDVANLTASGDITANDVTLSGALSVAGITTLTDDVSVGADINVTGNIAATDITASGDITADDVTTNGNLSVVGNATLSGASTAVTPAEDDNSTKIATTQYVQTEIKPIETDVTINDKRISNIEKLLQGNLYDYQTDTDSKYTKTVPQGAMPYASLNSIGGKTVVWNQLVNADGLSTTISDVSISAQDGLVTMSGMATSSSNANVQSINIVAGHKYLLFTSGVTYPISSDGYAFIQLYGQDIISVQLANNSTTNAIIGTATGGGTAYLRLRVQLGNTYSLSFHINIFDLTLLYGAGNEPTTVEEFQQTFPASYYPYNAGTLLSAGVTEVVSNSRNYADYSDGAGVPSNTASSGSTKRIYPIGKYISGMHYANYYNAGYVTATVTNNKIEVTRTAGSDYGVGIPFDCSQGVEYTASADSTIGSGTANMSLSWYTSDGTYISGNYTTASTYTQTAPTNAVQGLLILFPSTTNVTATYTNINIMVEGAVPITYPIPSEIQALEGYGWSAGTVSNYIDFERKVFVKNVERADLGTQSWSYSSQYGGIFTANFGYPDSTKNMINNPSGITCPRYAFKGVYSSLTDMSCGYIYYKNIAVKDDSFNGDTAAFKTAMSGVYAYYPLATPVEVDISAYLTDDNLISVEAGGTLTFPNSNGDDYRIPIPSSETYMVDLQASL